MQWELSDRVSRQICPRVLPARWQPFRDAPFAGGFIRADGMSVIVSAKRSMAGIWGHVSCAFGDRLPAYDDLQDVRRVFIPKEFTAVEVWARPSEHVNQNPYCRHLWYRLDGPTVPDFREAGGTI